MASPPAPAVPARVLALKARVFPDPYPNPLKQSTSLQHALDTAVAKWWTTPPVNASLAIVSISGPEHARPTAHVRGNEVHYSASLVKVAAMFSAFELRAAIRRIGRELGATTTKTELLRDASLHIDAAILAQLKSLPRLASVSKTHAVPKYWSTFKVLPAPSGTGFSVDFTPGFTAHLHDMIHISSNASAGECVHGSGYGYLNGALASAGFFDPVAESGIWLGGDYSHLYPYFRIPALNDKDTAQGATALQLARMLVLLQDGWLVSPTSSNQMLGLLAETLSAPREVFIDRHLASRNFEVTHTKVGLGPLKSGPDVTSEASIIVHTATGRKFVVAWQNFIAGATGFFPIAAVVHETLANWPPPF